MVLDKQKSIMPILKRSFAVANIEPPSDKLDLSADNLSSEPCLKVHRFENDTVPSLDDAPTEPYYSDDEDTADSSRDSVVVTEPFNFNEWIQIHGIKGTDTLNEEKRLSEALGDARNELARYQVFRKNLTDANQILDDIDSKRKVLIDELVQFDADKAIVTRLKNTCISEIRETIRVFYTKKIRTNSLLIKSGLVTKLENELEWISLP